MQSCTRYFYGTVSPAAADACEVLGCEVLGTNVLTPHWKGLHGDAFAFRYTALVLLDWEYDSWALNGQVTTIRFSQCGFIASPLASPLLCIPLYHISA